MLTMRTISSTVTAPSPPQSPTQSRVAVDVGVGETVGLDGASDCVIVGLGVAVANATVVVGVSLGGPVGVGVADAAVGGVAAGGVGEMVGVALGVGGCPTMSCGQNPERRSNGPPELETVAGCPIEARAARSPPALPPPPPAINEGERTNVPPVCAITGAARINPTKKIRFIAAARARAVRNSYALRHRETRALFSIRQDDQKFTGVAHIAGEAFALDARAPEGV
jgi:hypothetical protein